MDEKKQVVVHHCLNTFAAKDEYTRPLSSAGYPLNILYHAGF